MEVFGKDAAGAELHKALENGLSGLDELAGRFPQVSGMTLTVDPAQPPGARLQEVMIGGEQLDPDRLYQLATTDYVAGGGDGYGAFATARTVIGLSDSQLTANQVIDHLARSGEAAPAVEGRIRFVAEQVPRADAGE